MQVNDVMTPGAECTQPTATVLEAGQRMRDLDVGVLPVCGDDDRLAGMITDRDITVRAVAGSYDVSRAVVRDIMTPKVVSCFHDQDVREAASLMQENQVRRLVVLNRDKRLVGVLSLGDLAVIVHDDELAGHTLEAISEPAVPR